MKNAACHLVRLELLACFPRRSEIALLRTSPVGEGVQQAIDMGLFLARVGGTIELMIAHGFEHAGDSGFLRN